VPVQPTNLHLVVTYVPVHFVGQTAGLDELERRRIKMYGYVLVVGPRVPPASVCLFTFDQDLRTPKVCTYSLIFLLTNTLAHNAFTGPSDSQLRRFINGDDDVLSLDMVGGGFQVDCKAFNSQSLKDFRSFLNQLQDDDTELSAEDKACEAFDIPSGASIL